MPTEQTFSSSILPIKIGKKFSRAVAAAMLIFVSTASLADGNKLLSQCSAAEQFLDTQEIRQASDIGICIGLVQGVRNTWLYLQDSLPKDMQLCWPEQGINNGQAVRILVRFLRNNPAKLHEDEVLLAMLAFRNAYMCR